LNSLIIAFEIHDPITAIVSFATSLGCNITAKPYKHNKYIHSAFLYIAFSVIPAQGIYFFFQILIEERQDIWNSFNELVHIVFGLAFNVHGSFSGLVYFGIGLIISIVILCIGSILKQKINKKLIT
jgi:drug/metabolite transporter superfamily protein YnfA